MEVVFQVLHLNFPNAEQKGQAGLAVDRTLRTTGLNSCKLFRSPSDFLWSLLSRQAPAQHCREVIPAQLQVMAGGHPWHGPEQLCGRYLSRRCTPRQGSPRTRSSRWAPPQWCPSSCLAGSPCCSWRKAPAKKEPKQVNGANASLWQYLGFLQRY